MSKRRPHERMVEASNRAGRTYLRPIACDRYFWQNVEPDGDCWRWVGIKNQHDYGYVARQPELGSRDYVRIVAHRYAYEDLIGEVDPALDLDHLCMNRWCVNPYHLDPVPRAINNQRSRIARGFAA